MTWNVKRKDATPFAKSEARRVDRRDREGLRVGKNVCRVHDRVHGKSGRPLPGTNATTGMILHRPKFGRGVVQFNPNGFACDGKEARQELQGQ
jgi:hypothetical protein